MRSGDRRARRRGGELTRPRGRGARPGAEALERRELLTIGPIPLEVNAVPVTAINVPITNFTLAIFQDNSATPHIALIDWGDGFSPFRPDVTQATIVESPNAAPPGSSTYLVQGTHTYTAAGDFQIRINVLGDGQSVWAATYVTAVADFGGLPVPSGVAGTQIFNVPIAALSFNLAFAGGQFSFLQGPESYYVPINWGDGTGGIGNLLIGYGSVTDPLQPGDTPYFFVLGTHTYAEPGTYTVQINALGGPGQSLWAQTSIAVAAPSGQPGAIPFSALAGTPATNVPLAGFTAPSGAKVIAAVDWGDGTAPTFAAVVPEATPALAGGTTPGTSAYTVEGSHTYAKPGKHTVLVNVIEGKTSLWAASTATVDRSLSPVAGAPVSGIAGLALGNIPLAGFSGPASGQIIAAVDWGDGSTPSFATVVPSTTPAKSPSLQTSYLVVGSHNYAAPGTYTALINVIAPDGESQWGWSAVTIS